MDIDHKARVQQRTIQTLQNLIADMSSGLDDEGGIWTVDSLNALRRRVANALPPEKCPDWLQQFREPPLSYEAAITAICDMNKEILEDYCRRSIRPRIDAALSDGRDGEG